MNNNPKEYIKQWLSKANEDILVVEKLTESGIFAPSSACFHCQQDDQHKRQLLRNFIQVGT